MPAKKGGITMAILITVENVPGRYHGQLQNVMHGQLGNVVKAAMKASDIEVITWTQRSCVVDVRLDSSDRDDFIRRLKRLKVID